MNSSTSSSSIGLGLHPSIRSVVRPLLICLFLLSLYQTLIYGGVLPASEGISIQQSNKIKAEQYVYNNASDWKMVAVGSSRTAKIEPDYFGSDVANLGMRGGSSLTGLELVKRNKSKPSVVLVEVNGTIQIPEDEQLLKSVYHPLFYLIRRYFPMFRQEYQPVGVLMQWLKNRTGITPETLEQQLVTQLKSNPSMRDKIVEIARGEFKNPFSEKEKQNISERAEVMKTQIAELEKAGVRVVLFDLPGDRRVEEAARRKQERELMGELFPANTFEWAPQPPAKDWMTTDGIHLVRPEAKKYAAFLIDKLGLKNLAPQK